MSCVLESSISILVPSTTDIKVPKDTSEYVDRVACCFTSWFGGSTVHPPGKGYYLIDEEVVVEDIFKVESFCTTEDLERYGHRFT